MSDNSEYIPLRVTSGILMHIGAGIYNSVAGALKELVSNSYDADAQNVIISTGYPNFEKFIVVDDGDGMSETRWRTAMKFIGSSLKGASVIERRTKKFNRPIIGHLGIGLMALSQICNKATIESQEIGSETKFVAELDFSEFKQKTTENTKLIELDNQLSEFGGLTGAKHFISSNDTEKIQRIKDLLETEELNIDVIMEAEDLESEDLGYCLLYTNIPAIKGQHGTTITLTEIDDGVKNSLLDVGRPEEFLPEYLEKYDDKWGKYRNEIREWSWEELIIKLQSQISYQSLPQYYQFLWELALITPVKYLSTGPIEFDLEVLSTKKKELEKNKFSLNIDDITLYKPILLPSGKLAKSKKLKKGADYVLQEVSFNKVIGGDPLKFHGYLYWQRNQNEPDGIRGLQIYVRNVGIGLYDSSLLGYRDVNPTSRAGQISGEIYVDSGLDKALNVDRNSFKETDSQYIQLQRCIWDLLGSTRRGDGILGASVDSYYIRLEQKEKDDYEEQALQLKELISSLISNDVDIEVNSKLADEPYEITGNKIIVNSKSSFWPRKRVDRNICQKILIGIKAAQIFGDNEDLVEIVENIVKEL
ncbi:MAG: ATP-binding protein [Anaerolineaceae bacterium]|nr:ATP-binding protein [Anaerolineaceae bacterium]